MFAANLVLFEHMVGGGSGDNAGGDGVAGGEAVAAVGGGVFCRMVGGNACRDAGGGGVLLQDIFGLHGASQQGRGEDEKRGESFHRSECLSEKRYLESAERGAKVPSMFAGGRSGENFESYGIIAFYTLPTAGD